MRISVAENSWKRFREKGKALFEPGRGQNLERFIREGLNLVLRGWLQCFGIGASKQKLESHYLWIRRRLRDLIWRQGKTPATRFKNLRELGCPLELALIANSLRGPWWCAGAPAVTQHLSPMFFRQKGLLSLCPDMLACDL